MIEQLNHAAGAWARSFSWGLVQNTLFLLLVFALLRLLRRAPASVRYAVAMAGLIKLCLPPLFALPISAPGAMARVPAELDWTAAVPLITAPPGAFPGVSEGAALSLSGLLFVVWTAVGCAYVCACAYAIGRLAWSLRDATPLPARTSRAYVGHDRVRLLQSDRIGTPLTLAIHPRRIFIPAVWRDWSDACRRLIVRHELAHLQRRDGLLQIVQIVALAGYFFHPLVWILARRVRRYREMACDDRCVDGEPRAIAAYIRYLLEIAEAAHRRPPACDPAATLIGRRRELLGRIHYQLKGDRMRRLSRRSIAWLAAGLFLGTLLLSWHVCEVSAGSSPALPASPGPVTASAHVAIVGQEVSTCRSDQRTEIAVTLTNEGGVTVGEEAVELEDLPAMLRTRATGPNEECIVSILCGSEVPVRLLFAVQDILTQEGLLQVRYRNTSGWEMPLVLPPGPLRERARQMPPEYFTVLEVDRGDAIRLDGRRVLPADVPTRLREILEANEHLIVAVRFDGEVDYVRFLEVMGGVQQADATRVFVELASER